MSKITKNLTTGKYELNINPTSTSQSKTLKLGGTYCDADIIVNVGSGLVPTGNIELTTNASTDVTNYETATVRSAVASMPSSLSGSSATINISNGTITLTKSVTNAVVVTTAGWLDSLSGTTEISLSGTMAEVTPTFDGGTPSLTDTSNSISVTGMDVSSSATSYYVDASASAKATRSALTYDNDYEGYLNKTSGTSASAAETSSAGTINATRVYINGAAYIVENSSNNGTSQVSGGVTPTTSDQYINVSAGYTDASYVKINAVSTGTITNNTSGGTSSGTINSGSQIKIGAGYYPNDVYYTAQSAPSYSTYDGSYTIS